MRHFVAAKQNSNEVLKISNRSNVYSILNFFVKLEVVFFNWSQSSKSQLKQRSKPNIVKAYRSATVYFHTVQILRNTNIIISLWLLLVTLATDNKHVP